MTSVGYFIVWPHLAHYQVCRFVLLASFAVKSCRHYTVIVGIKLVIACNKCVHA